MSETLDFNQLEQHDFDLGVRDIDADHETRCKELFNRYGQLITCLLYTSDAADE